jgi:hypothetical protein
VTSPVVPRYFITGGSEPMPDADRVIYADGSAGSMYRPGIDMELSHWVPNDTPRRWAADTSTATCLRFASDPQAPDGWDLAVNNHADVDGILSLFSLVHTGVALAHREIVVGAAELGDFSAAGARSAFDLAQEITLVMLRAREQSWDIGRTYATTFDVATAVLSGSHAASPAVSAGWAHLQRGEDRIADGQIAVEVVARRVVSFTLPELEGTELVAGLRVPAFTALVDDSVWLWPQTRSRHHAEAVHLVSTPGPNGWFHDVWLPGYSWADTPNRWTPPGLRSTGTSNEWLLDHPPLTQAVSALRRQERNPGSWLLADRLTPFASVAGRGFPIVVSFVDAVGAPAPSSIAPVEAARPLGTAFPDA